MIIFLDTNADQWETAQEEIGPDHTIGQLMTPLTRYADRGVTYAIDNGAFSGFDAKAFRSLLDRQEPAKDRCKWVAVPDVVGNARRTLEVFHVWYERIGWWPLAFVAQDGIDNIEIPWHLIECIFIGGTTEWKLSASAEQTIRAAQALSKWVHVGRVNTPERIAKFVNLGVDSIDGTGISRYSWMRRAIADGNYHPLFGDDAGTKGESL